MTNRREFLGITAGVGAALSVPPELLRLLRQQGGKLLQRAIPSTGELLPIISYGPRPAAGASLTALPSDVVAMKPVLKAFLDSGGKFVDVLHGGPAGEEAARAAASELRIQDKFFWSTPLSVVIPVLPGYAGPPVTPGAAEIRAAMEAKFAAFKVDRIDLVMVGAGPDAAAHLAVLKEMKREGRVRYIGVHDLLLPPTAQFPGSPTARLEALMRSEPIDFVGTDYSAGDRRVEQTLLPLAQERKIGFLAYFPFDRRRIFQRASETPLPAWAAEFGARTWAQFFIKYVASHPAVVMVRTGTTKAEHMLENIEAGIGPLPNAAQRHRMAELVDSFPPTPVPAPPAPQPRPQEAPVVLSAAILDRYVGEYRYAVANQMVTFRRDGERLLMKIAGNAPEGGVVPRSETRFQGPFGLVIEFQLGAQGNVTGAVVEQGPYRLQLERK